MIFIAGKATIKQGRKTIAKVFDRDVFYPANNIKGKYSHKYSLEISGGLRECDTIDEVNFFIEKYT